MAAKGKKSEQLTSIPGETVTAEKPQRKPRARTEKLKAMYKEEQKVGKALATKAVDPEILGTTNKMGRPTSYTPEVADEIISRLAMGQSMRTVAKQEHLPAVETIFRWMRTFPDFQERYTMAKKEAADMMAEDIMDISDDGQNDYMEMTYGDQSILRINSENIQRSRLRVETRKWLASKLQPTKYGDKIDVTSNGKQLPTPLLSGLVDANHDISAEKE